MSSSSLLAQAGQHLGVGVSMFALMANLGAPAPAAAQEHPATATPIQHVIVIIGENRSFDHVYATYKPAKGQTVSNLLSKGIINANGQAGPNWALAAQSAALDEGRRRSRHPRGRLGRSAQSSRGGGVTACVWHDS